MDNAPILLNIAQQITDFRTLMNFMLVNKKCLQVVRYVIREAPTVFIPFIYYETNAECNKQYMYDSLKELFTQHHKYYLENPNTVQHYLTGQIVENRAGPCWECLLYGLSIVDYGNKTMHHQWQGCGCNDIEYNGIKTVKYFHASRPIFTNEFNWCPSLATTNEGFSMSRHLDLPFNPQAPIEPDIDPESVDRRSMEYLYFGCPPVKTLIKLGIREWWSGKWNRFYPATTDNLDRCSVFIISKYDPNNTYVDFSKSNNKWEYHSYHNTI